MRFYLGDKSAYRRRWPLLSHLERFRTKHPLQSLHLDHAIPQHGHQTVLAGAVLAGDLGRTLEPQIFPTSTIHELNRGDFAVHIAGRHQRRVGTIRERHRIIKLHLTIFTSDYHQTLSTFTILT